ncbi:hypothetical protein CKO15_12180 [Halorhodospira abdelmalekii]|uniref:(2Fe-2S)-binding protein n=1 Tax=Halorhodospira abdelmalekii TaxID=421629 RepID=UPI0019046C7E|nr:(2Fe-2S)-binding protein [Halorhodospira abdelmalekii]MBK1736020.1 hypothetical protein [Halorhodospira abdelmalekii]
MYVCICKAVTEQQVREAIADGHGSLPALCAQLGVTAQCGKCREEVQELVAERVAVHCTGFVEG